MKRKLVALAMLAIVWSILFVAEAHARGGWRFGIYAGLPAYYPPPPVYYYPPPPPPAVVARPYYYPAPVPYYAPAPRAFIGFGF